MDRLAEDALARLLRDLEQADLGDPRRVKRAQEIVQRLGRAPGASLPSALVTSAELEGAYRFFSNASITFDSLLEPHIAGTVERARRAGRVLAVHDTTTCSCPHADPADAGVLPTGKAGFLLHLALVIDPTGWPRPLGIAHAETISRPQRSNRQHRTSNGNNVSGKQTAKWENKEYERWFRGTAAVQKRLDGVEVIHVADRESDSYLLMSSLVEAKQHFIFRARGNRVVDDGGTKRPLRDVVDDAAIHISRD